MMHSGCVELRKYFKNLLHRRSTVKWESLGFEIGVTYEENSSPNSLWENSSKHW